MTLVSIGIEFTTKIPIQWCVTLQSVMGITKHVDVSEVISSGLSILDSYMGVHCEFLVISSGLSILDSYMGSSL